MKYLNLKALLSILVVLAFSTACRSTGTTGPVVQVEARCTDESCDPNTEEFLETVSATDSGSLWYAEILPLAEQFEKDYYAAIDSLVLRVNAYSCGPACDKIITTSETYTLTPSTTDVAEDSQCDFTFSTEVSATGGAPTCKLARVAMAQNLMSQLGNLNDICEQHNPVCGTRTITYSDSDPADTPKPDNGLFWCTVEVTVPIIVECGLGSVDSLENMAIDAELKAFVECKEPDLSCTSVKEEEPKEDPPVCVDCSL